MELILKRQSSRSGWTPGELLWQRATPVHECWTVEDEIREIPGVPVVKWKISGKTAIPAGRFPLIIDYSQRFQRPMPHVMDVPGFAGVRLHIANTAADVEGCGGLGRGFTPNGVSESAVAFNEFMPKLEAVLKSEKCWITYINPLAVVT